MLRIFLFLLFFIPLAYAQPEKALSAYERGDYLEAVQLTETSHQASDLAFSARCVLAEAMSLPSGEPTGKVLERAEKFARRALAIDETHIEARLQLAITLSLQARPMPNLKAMRSGLGQQAKALAEEIVAEDPGNAYAHTLLAIWHMEVMRRGGRLGARLMGASADEATAHYAAAARTLPDDGALHWQWARILAATNAQKFRDEIEMALTASISAQTNDTLESVMQARSKRLEPLIKSGDYKAAEELAVSLL